MKLWIAIALVGCSYKDREQEPPPSSAVVVPQAAVAPPNMPLIHAQVAGNAAPAPPPPRAPIAPLPGLPLQVTYSQCAKADCLPATPGSGSTIIGLQSCPIATGLELGEAIGFSSITRCGLAIRNGTAISNVDTMVACKSPDDAGKAVPRTKAVGATCTGDELDVELQATDAKVPTTIRVACRVADHGFVCAREPNLGAGGGGVARTLADVKRVVEAHQWRALLAMCDPDHRKGQLSLGQDEPTYLAEILGLHFEGNSLGTGDDKPITFATLSAITKVEAIEISRQGSGSYGVLGFVTLESGMRLRFEVFLDHRGSRFWLTSHAVG